MTGPSPGRVLADRYELVSPAGRGPHGVVWRATDHATHLNLAVKLLDADIVSRPEVVDRFHRERKVLTAFLDPAVVRVQELVHVDDTLALVSEFVDGEDLRRRLDRLGYLPRSEALAIALALADALRAAHAAGVVHCDIKPTNILLAAPHGTARLTDCRVARLSRAAPSGAEPLPYAAEGYAAPEVTSGGTPVPVSDIYALGAVLRELVGDPSGHPELQAIVEDCLLPEADLRPTAAQVVARLRRLAPAFASADPAAAAHEYGHSVSHLPREPPRQLSWALVPIGTAAQPAAPRFAARRRRRTHTSAIIAVAALLGATAGAALVARGMGGLDEPLSAATSAPASAAAGLATRAGDDLPSASNLAAPPADTPSSVESTSFAHEWFGALNLAVSSGDTTRLAAASSPACQACQLAVAFVTAAYANGGALRGGTYVIRTIQVDQLFSAGTASLHVIFDRTTRSAVSPTGEVVDDLTGRSFLTAHLILERAGDGWRTREVQTATPII